jgi:hypothetical protein
MRIGISVVVLFFAGLVQTLSGQTNLDQIPQKGLVPGLSYVTSNIDTISTSNGNLSLRIPLVSLPPDRDGQAATLSQKYNSKLWEAYAVVRNDPNQAGAPGSCSPLTTYFLAYSDDAGWSYGSYFLFRVLRRADHYLNDACTPACSSGGLSVATNLWKYQVVFPDGGVHELVPRGNYSPIDGYYNRAPDGTTAACGQNTDGSWFLTYNTDNTPLSFYTTDGSFARMDIPIDTTHQNLGLTYLWGWTLSFEDGRRVKDFNPTNPGIQRIYGRNGVSNNFYVEIGPGYVKDSVGRTINKSTTNPTSSTMVDTITATGYGPTTLTWTVNWSLNSSTQKYIPYDFYPSRERDASVILGCDEHHPPYTGRGTQLSIQLWPHKRHRRAALVHATLWSNRDISIHP